MHASLEVNGTSSDLAQRSLLSSVQCKCVLVYFCHMYNVVSSCIFPYEMNVEITISKQAYLFLVNTILWELQVCVEATIICMESPRAGVGWRI